MFVNRLNDLPQACAERAAFPSFLICALFFIKKKDFFFFIFENTHTYKQNIFSTTAQEKRESVKQR